MLQTYKGPGTVNPNDLPLNALLGKWFRNPQIASSFLTGYLGLDELEETFTDRKDCEEHLACVKEGRKAKYARVVY